MRERLKDTEAEKSECQSELKALREILTSIEQQKREYQKKNNAIDVTHEELNRKVNDLVIQRSRTQVEMDRLKEENARMVSELEKAKLAEKVSASAAVAPAASACSADTVLTLQKMIANLETSKDGLVADLTKKDDLIKSQAEKVAQLEIELRVQREMASTDGESDSELKRKLSGVLSENEEIKPRLSHLEEEKESLDEEVSNLKSELADKQERIDNLENSMKQLQTDVDAKAEKIWYHEETISSLQETKERIEADLSEASDAIALLEDELDQKESAVNAANVQVTILRQKVSQLEKEKGLLSKSSAELEDQIRDLNTQIKVIQMEKHVSNEEMESLREAKEKAEDELHEIVQSSGAQIAKLQEELDESSDAIAVLKEELGIVEHHLAEKDDELQDAQKANTQLQEENQVGVETIASLRKLIQTNDQKKTDLELELSAMTKNTNELGEELKKSASQVRDLEGKLSECDERNMALVESVSHLTNTNEEIKKQMHEIILETTSTAVVTRSASAGTSLKIISLERAKTVDSLISDLRQQIQDLLSERDAALEEVEVLKAGGSEALCPTPDQDADVLTEAPEDDHEDDHDDDMTYHTSALETKPCEEEEASIPMTIEPTIRKKSAGASLSSYQPSHEGSSLLEQAKSIVQELEVKRSKTPDAKRGNTETEDETPLTRRSSRDGSIKTVHNNIKGKELEGLLENVPDTNAASRTNSAASDKKFDIDQLTAIYFEKCGMSASKLSDMSSDASSSVYRRAKQQKDKDAPKAKKVKICRNGVFMGTYEGDLNSKGQRHGFGVLICDNGNSYEGDWKNDKRDGLGIARYSSGDVYDGEWKRGKRQGHGVMYIEAGDTYIGSWEKGLKHGAGTYHWADGEVDVSWYEEDRRVGQGVRWNATRNKAFQLVRGTRQKEIALDEAYKTAEKLGLNLAKADSGSS
jgi:predicted  nucleic acid-binding Zn-ribbon protein